MSIEVRNITKKFMIGDSAGKPFVAVDDVSFVVPEGHLVALLGPSGSGKSTILRIIAGLEQPDRGEVFLNGEPMTYRAIHERGVGFVFQHYALFKHMTVAKNIAFGLEVNKRPAREIRERVDTLLDLVRLKGYEDRYPSQLSGGQQQRVALARALAPHPRVLLLDEPFGALDAKVRRNLATQLRQLHEEVHTTSVFVTHDQEEAIEIADRIVVINHGRVEQIGSAEEVYDKPKSKFVASFIGNVNVIEGSAKNGTIHIGPDCLSIPYLKGPTPDCEIVLLVRPEAVELDSDIARNGTTGTIRGIRYRGDRYELDIDVAGQDIRVVQDKARGKALKWAQGQRVAVHFNRCTVFEAQEGHAALMAKLQSLGYIE